MNKINLLITGSQGRIGKILMRELSQAYSLWGLDRSVAPADEREYSVDIGHFEELSKAFGEIQRLSGSIDAVVHMAANPRLDAPWDSVLQNNIVGTKNVYECVRQNGIKKVVFASTNHMTGGYERDAEQKAMISTSDPVRPNSDYATSKVFGEALARQYWEVYGIRSICLRIGSVLVDDDPTKIPRTMKTWLSYRDLVQLVRKALEVSVNFGIYYGVSNNDGRFWDISNAEDELGYYPDDNAAILQR